MPMPRFTARACWALAVLCLATMPAAGQIFRPPVPGPGQPPSGAGPGGAPKIDRQDAPPPGIVVVRAVTQEVEGSKYRLRGQAELETSDVLLKADEIDYDQETGLAEARGRVSFVNFAGGERMNARRVDYDFKAESGTFYEVKGSAPVKIDYRPGILMTDNPFRFEGKWAEKLKERVILYQGTLTNCEEAKPWWRLQAPRFDIIPADRALVTRAMLRLKGVPLLYAPAFYKSLVENPRRSGFLTPNFGNTNVRGQMFGAAYYWAINRSFDTTYRLQYFSLRGFAHTLDFRGKPTRNSEFDAFVYGVADRGLPLPDGTRRPEGGYMVSLRGNALLPKGFYARGMYNFLSNFTFRQAFTETFNEAVFSEVNSAVYAARDWSTYHFGVVYTEQQNFQSTLPGDKIGIRRLPQLEFHGRDREVTRKVLPVWVSWESRFGLLRRDQPLFQTRQFVTRMDVEPRVMTALRWKGIHVIPAASLRQTNYGMSFLNGQVDDANLNRFSREFSAQVILPTLYRIFDVPQWMGGRLKHSIEPRAAFRTVGGVGRLDRFIRFDEMDILANTTEAEYMISNRIWSKDARGVVRDYLSWDISQRRFFDPTFGGAVVAGQRNVIATTAQMSAYTLLDGPRSLSPVVSALRVTPRPSFGIEWRTDYDPFRRTLWNSSLMADVRLANYFVSVGHNKVSCIPFAPVGPQGEDPCVGHPRPGTVLSPPANQFRGMIGLGQESRRGWNAGFLTIYDYTTATMQFINTQITYNTSCCAFSGQYRRFGFGVRNENQFRLAFVIANIGSFGTLRRQERLF
jgi:LPS-assembly protein